MLGFAAARFDVEADVATIRGEIVRAIRGSMRSPAPVIERPLGSPRRGALRTVAGILQDLEQSIAAISLSLAEGVDHLHPTNRTRPPSGGPC